MDVTRARVAIRERPLLDVVDLAVRFCLAHARVYARLSAAVLVPAFAVSWAVARSAGWPWAWFASLALVVLVDAPFTVLASRLVFADEARVRDALRAAASASASLLALRVVGGVAFAISLVFAGIPWLWAGSAILFVPEVVLLERSGVARAAVRSMGIATSHLGIVIAAMLMLSALALGATVVADAAGRELLQSVLELRAPASMFEARGSVLALVGFWAVRPLWTAARFFVYLDVRTRTEGWDIQTRFAALGSRP